MKSIGNLFRIGLLSFLVGCCAGSGLHDTPPATISSSQNMSGAVEVEKLRQSTVAIVSNTLGLLIPNCAGVWVDADIVLSAAHCADDPDEPFVLVSTSDDYEKDKYRPAIVLARSEELDLALLVVDPKDIPPHPIAQLSNRQSFVGDEVHIVGHTSGFSWTYSKGYISAIRDDMPGPGGKQFEKALQISAPVWMGNSGGGAFNKEGKLVGISSWISRNGPHLSFFVHVDVIEKFILKEMARRK